MVAEAGARLALAPNVGGAVEGGLAEPALEPVTFGAAGATLAPEPAPEPEAEPAPASTRAPVTVDATSILIARMVRSICSKSRRWDFSVAVLGAEIAIVTAL